MATGKFVCYFRVSTKRQGESGLGIDAQKSMVEQYLNGGKWDIRGEFTEHESGKRHEKRPKLKEAMDLCRKEKATLLIAKLDRLARNVHFISGLMESGVRFVAVESPNDDAFTLHIKAAVAEREALEIGRRTKAALAEAAKRGTVLGGRRVSAERWTEITAESNKQRSQMATERASSIIPVINALRPEGAVTLRDIAAKLNERNILTARGGQWSAVQVQRVMQRMNA